MKRRQLLQLTSLLAGSMIVPVGVKGWVAKSVAQTNSRQQLIVILLRGAVDGLNVVIPYQEELYYELRPTIAIPPPRKKKGVLDLDGYFGLHPALAELMPFWEQNQLAFVHACGSTDATRSHFDAQMYMESGTPGTKSTTDGWMNRLLTNLPPGRPTQAISRGNSTPHILAGTGTVANLPPGNNATNNLPIDNAGISSAFDSLYSGEDPLSLAYQEGREAREIVRAELQEDMREADGGAPSPVAFVNDARRMARLMVGDAKTQLGFLDLGKWDTHVNQGSSEGHLARNLQQVGAGLATLVKELGSVFADTTIVVMSEFGRTVKENGNGGTDHGHGNVMWLLGGNLRGGKVYGEWLGLEKSQLYEGRDLPITTDFRDVLTTVLVQHMQMETSQLNQVFPRYSVQQNLNLFA